jgi:twitching motility protein PilT
METQFLEEFERLCYKGDNGAISDFIITEDANVAYVKNDTVCQTETRCPSGVFDEIKKEFIISPREGLGEGNYDGAWNFKNWRFRINGFRTMGKNRIVLRMLPARIIPIDELGLPDRVMSELEMISHGLVLVCGATGSGKSTTISSVVDHLCRSAEPRHVITLEEPVEYIVGEGSESTVSQRQIGPDVPSFASGLRMALRQKPNVIVVGEIRDSETASIALQAAQTGHLVFSTLHTGRAAESVERFLEMLPSGESGYSVSILADMLQMVVCQRLLKSHDGGRIAMFEVYRKFQAATNSIRQKNFNALKDMIKTGKTYGCCYMSDSYNNLKNRDLTSETDLIID